MSTLSFDTHRFIRKLRDAGVPEVQAEAMADALKEASGEAELATKRDIERLEVKLNAELNLIRWMLVTVIGLAVANFAKQFF